MSLEEALGAMLLGSLVLYALSGGADFGGGMWDLLATGPRARRQREAIEHSIAPIWEAGHVWLILVIVGLFTGFPPAFAAIMAALNIPMAAILLGIVLRGSGFVFRKYDAPDDRVHRGWSLVFGVSSLFTPFLLGVCLGALASGDIRVAGGSVLSGFFAGWTSGFAVACGLFAAGLFAFLAATYLTIHTERERDVQDRFRKRALAAGLSLAPAAAVTFVLARRGAPMMFAGLTSWWALWLLALTSVCAAGGLWGLWARRFRWARLAAVGQVVCILLGWGFAKFPYLVVPDVTLANSAAEQATLSALVWALLAGAVILFPVVRLLFYAFKSGFGPCCRRRG
jgi:cytochrome d ubiquinol oxidase subunit II